MNSVIYVLKDYTFEIVAAGAVVLGTVCGMLGTFAVMRKKSLMGDGISHATLPGVVLIFLLFGVKDTVGLLTGALFAGLIASWLILLIVQRSKLRFDAALALVMSVFFGLGMTLLTQAQKMENSNQAGLDRFIFGQVSALLFGDVILMLTVGLVLFAISLLFFKEIKLHCFDRGFAESIGFSPRVMDAVLDLMMVFCIIMGLQTVGVILMSALLIAPAVAARQWTDKFGTVTALSCIIGAVSGFIGVFISTLSPKMPTGPAIVVVVSVIVIISLMLSPERGILAKLLLRRRIRRSIIKRGKSDESAN